MLLEALKNQIASQIISVEDQIASLQQQLLELQSHAQQILSVEQACESAIAQVRTANTMIEAIAPDQVAVFKAAIDAEFNQPIGQLMAATDDDEPAPQVPTPEPVEPEPQATEVVIDIDVEAVEPAPHTNGNGNGNGHVKLEDLKELDWQTLRKLAKINGVNTKGMQRPDIEEVLTGKVTQESFDAVATAK